MKFFVARGLAIFAIAALLPALSSAAQSAPPPQSQPQAPAPKGQVIFSRSTDASGKTTTQAGPAAPQPAIQKSSEPTVEDADRRAAAVTALNLDVHLEPIDHHLAVRALVTVRNDGKTPLTHIPLQISSDLHWDQVRVQGHDVSAQVATLNSDADHTGQLHEAEIPLAQPLAPGAALKLDVAYSGVIIATAKRLTAVGTPQNLAIRSDWDEISQTFTGLRGFGNVVWYPVSSVPAILGDGNRLFQEIGTQKLRMQDAPFTLHLTVEFRQGQPPTIVVVNGQPVPLDVHDAGGLDPEVLGVATASVQTTVGFQSPSLFVAMRAEHAGDHLDAWATPDNDTSVGEWLKEAGTVSPFLEQWLGHHSSRNLTLLDPPDLDDAPFETGSLLVVPLGDQTASQLDSILVHELTHAWLHRPPAWLDEGVATFLSTLWVEQHQGREKALEMLEAQREALALVEPSSPGESTGEPLPRATDPVYFRTKAAYVLWMLRDLASDGQLAQALQGWAAEPGNDTGSSAQSDSATLQQLLKKAGVTRDLSWFFADWVNADKGLPDLSIVSVYPTAVRAGSYLVAVNLANNGYAAAEVPLTVRSAETSVTQRILIPAQGKVVRRLLIVGRPTEVQLNDGTVPETQASVHVMHLPAAPASSNSFPATPQ